MVWASKAHLRTLYTVCGVLNLAIAKAITNETMSLKNGLRGQAPHAHTKMPNLPSIPSSPPTVPLFPLSPSPSLSPSHPYPPLHLPPPPLFHLPPLRRFPLHSPSLKFTSMSLMLPISSPNLLLFCSSAYRELHKTVWLISRGPGGNIPTCHWRGV